MSPHKKKKRTALVKKSFPGICSIKQEKAMSWAVGQLVPLSLGVDILKNCPDANQQTWNQMGIWSQFKFRLHPRWKSESRMNVSRATMVSETATTMQVQYMKNMRMWAMKEKQVNYNVDLGWGVGVCVDSSLYTRLLPYRVTKTLQEESLSPGEFVKE